MEKLFLSAGEASRFIGCSITTLKKYEEEGLLVPTVVAGKSKRLFSVGQVHKFIIDYCGGDESYLAEEQEQSFLSSGQVRRKLSISNEVLDLLEEQKLLLPRRRLPLNKKRLYLESDVEKFLSKI